VDGKLNVESCSLVLASAPSSPETPVMSAGGFAFERSKIAG